MGSYLRRRAALARSPEELTIIPPVRLHTKCILRAAGSRYPFYCAASSSGELSGEYGTFRPGIDPGAKGIKSLSISGIPRRCRRRPRLHLQRSIYPVTDSSQVRKLGRGGIFVLLRLVQRRSLMKYCTASFVPLLTKRDAWRKCTRGIISQLDNTNDAKLAQRDGFNFVCKFYGNFFTTR